MVTRLEEIYYLEFPTLEQIHSLLGIKQGLKNYVRNTNKKYGMNWSQDEVLDSDIVDIIVLNTLGKLKRHNDQYKYLELMAYDQNQSEKIEKAMKFAELSNLADSIINSAKVLTSLDFLDTVANSEAIGEIMFQKGIPNAQYFSPQGKLQWFKDNLKYLIDSYNMQK